MLRSTYSPPPLSLCHQSFISLTPVELIDVASAAGFASVGLRTQPSAPGGPAYSIKNGGESFRQLKYRVEDTGVSVFCIETVAIDERTIVSELQQFLEDGCAIGAERVLVNGASSDFSVVADRLAQLCERAAPLNLTVELEFMPFRAVRSLEDACEIVRRVAAPNCQVLVDALHFSRSGGSPAQLSQVPRALVGTFHICDAPSVAPVDLIAEARAGRLLPGEGDLLITDMLNNLAPDVPLGVEIPLRQMNCSAEEAATRMASASLAILERRNNKRG